MAFHVCVLLSLGNLAIALEESIRAGLLDIELQMEKNALLHSQNLGPSVCIVGQIDEIFDVRWVNLLILSRDEKRSDAHKLHIALEHVKDGKVAIDQVNGEEERLWQQLKFGVHTNDPIN